MTDKLPEIYFYEVFLGDSHKLWYSPNKYSRAQWTQIVMSHVPGFAALVSPMTRVHRSLAYDFIAYLDDVLPDDFGSTESDAFVMLPDITFGNTGGYTYRTRQGTVTAKGAYRPEEAPSFPLFSKILSICFKEKHHADK